MNNHYDFPDSTMLASCDYDSNEKELTVTFKNGRSYVYADVPVDIYNDLIGSKSAGRYFNSVKGELKQK